MILVAIFKASMAGPAAATRTYPEGRRGEAVKIAVKSAVLRGAGVLQLPLNSELI